MTDKKPAEESGAPPVSAPEPDAVAVSASATDPELPATDVPESDADRVESDTSSDETAASPESPITPPLAAVKTSAPGWGSLALLLLIVLAVLAVAAYFGRRELLSALAQRDSRIAALEAAVTNASGDLDVISDAQEDQRLGLSRQAAAVDQLSQRLHQQGAAVSELNDIVSGGPLRVQLAMVEQLLMLASDRLLVARDVPAALAALQAADDRLARLRDPRVFPVREAIARERAALQAVPLPDETGTALVLASLAERVPGLPLTAQLPSQFSAGAETPPAGGAAPETPGAWSRLRASLAGLFDAMFTIKREDGPPPRLLSDEQSALILQMLQMKLEGARLSLLRGDAGGFRDYCESAAHWLDSYFRTDDTAVQSMRTELLRLSQLKLNPPLPDISRSLGLLRLRMGPSDS